MVEGIVCMYTLEQNLKYKFPYTKTVTISLADTFRSSTFFSSEDDFFYYKQLYAWE